MENKQAYFVDTQWTWKDRLRWRLFPSVLCPLPEAPATYADCLVMKTMVRLGWADRLRVLVSGWLTVETKTVTEGVIGKSMTSSVAYPMLPPGSLNV